MWGGHFRSPGLIHFPRSVIPPPPAQPWPGSCTGFPSGPRHSHLHFTEVSASASGKGVCTANGYNHASFWFRSSFSLTAEECKRSGVSNQLCSRLGGKTTSSAAPAARDSVLSAGSTPHRVRVPSVLPKTPSRRLGRSLCQHLSSTRKTQALSSKGAEMEKPPHQGGPLQHGKTRLSSAGSDRMKTACAFRRQHGTYRGTTTNKTIRHVAGQGTSPSVQARHLGTHIDESFTVTTSKQKMTRSFRRQKCSCKLPSGALGG